MVNSSFFRAGCFAAVLSSALVGCKTYRGNDGEKALWASIESGPSTEKNLKDPAKLNLAYARLQEHLGQLGDARRFYQLALEEDPKSVEATLGIARLDQLAGREQQAEAGAQKALQLKPNDPFVQHSVGQFYASKNQWAKAGELISRAVMAEPENNVYRYDFAVALARAGRADQAMPHFVKSVGEAEAHYNIAYILYQQGNPGLAEQHLVQALSKRGDLKPAKQLLAEIRGMKNDQAALAATAQPKSGVAQASLTVGPNTGRATQIAQQTPQGRGRLVLSSGQQQQQQQTPAIRPGQTSTQATAHGAGYAAPMQRTYQQPAQSAEVEQWNHQTGVW